MTSRSQILLLVTIIFSEIYVSSQGKAAMFGVFLSWNQSFSIH